MRITDEFAEKMSALLGKAVRELLVEEDFRDVCESLHVSKMYYDMDLGGEGKFRNQKTNELVFWSKEVDDKIILFDNGEMTDLKMSYTYFDYGVEHVHAYIEFKTGIRKEDLDLELYQMMADLIYMLVSFQNVKAMLEFAEITDAQTGIPNSVFIRNKYQEVIKKIATEDLAVLYINLQNFKYINEVNGSRSGDEAIIKYARMLVQWMDEDECACRLGGDKFAIFVKKENLASLLKKIDCIQIDDLKSAPNQAFEVSAWVGYTYGKKENKRPFMVLLEEASIACNEGKDRLKSKVTEFSPHLMQEMSWNRKVVAIFHPAIKNKEFNPFFQAKVDMRTGELVGFEALCRWVHQGKCIYPDQFIPILDKEGLICELDFEIFRQTCAAIRKWKDMGLQPPRISSNFSRKNLFVPNIEDVIYKTIIEYGLSTEDIEVEITESVGESEYNRLIEFVRKLKQNGIHIAIDDFGTGYSSLSLIHNIDADVIKIDKSFVDKMPGDEKTEILIESVISIAKRLNADVIAEGIETAEQGRALMKLGCCNAQGYYYSKPMDFDSATKVIADSPYKAV